MQKRHNPFKKENNLGNLIVQHKFGSSNPRAQYLSNGQESSIDATEGLGFQERTKCLLQVEVSIYFFLSNFSD